MAGFVVYLALIGHFARSIVAWSDSDEGYGSRVSWVSVVGLRHSELTGLDRHPVSLGHGVQDRRTGKGARCTLLTKTAQQVMRAQLNHSKALGPNCPVARNKAAWAVNTSARARATSSCEARKL